MLHHGNNTSLSIHVIAASDLKDVETLGKNDPYVQCTLDYNNKNAYLRTSTKKDAGNSATWNEAFNTALNGEADLFVEVLDEERSVDEVIGFAAIPLNQVVNAPGAHLNAIFDIYDTKENRAGQIHLQLVAQGFPNSQPPNFNSEPIRGQSYVEEGHRARMKSTNRKAAGVTVGGALLGGALAVGAGFLGKKLYDDRKAEDEQEEEGRDESEPLRNDEREHDNENEGRHERRHENDDYDGDARKWNPVGTYAPGDRVSYHGQVYVCLQGHTSNPTWQPGAAHSLWQA
ncbi:C2 domain-containing protein, partial [Mycotypha africana]|uniref:C2 domain-containing protein n=1 Tax=Mycotypha africana TaxID=64632 RepID=UPI00230076F2